MQETLISFETAKLAKEKGFEFHNWHEDYKYDFYCIVDFINDWRDSINNYKVGEEVEGYYLSPLSDDKKNIVILRPTQSLLQKWLREVHNIIITPLPTKNKWFFNIQFGNGLNTNFEDFDSEDYYKSYEEALESALQEALKLI